MAEIRIKKSVLRDQATRLSSFEGREAFTPAGDSDYENIHITDQDESLIDDYIIQGALELASYMADHLPSASFSTTDADEFVVIVFEKDTTRINSSSLSKQSGEAITAYVLRQWLSDRRPDRVQFYSDLFTEMANAAMRTLAYKIKPTPTWE